MSVSTFKIGKKEYVILTRKRYPQLRRAAEYRLDSEIARKGREEWLAGKLKTITHEEVRRKWGV